MLDARYGQAWDRYADWAAGWLDLHHAVGVEPVVDTYRTLLAGAADPRVGYLGSLWSTPS